MRVGVVSLALGAACLVWLAGCQTVEKLSDLKLPDPLAPQASATDDQPTGSAPSEKPLFKLPDPLAPQASATDDQPTGAAPSEKPLFKLPDLFAPRASATDDQPTGSTPIEKRVEKPGAVTPRLLGTDPNDDLSIAKKYFRQGSYGLAERYFRKAVEQHPRDAESWLGLAAAYDRLKRFDLADRAYAQAIKLVGSTPEILNNQGFSYILRGDYRRAHAILMQAQAAAPNNPYIKNNLRLLSASERKGKAVN
jgi:tetratricopeptide (TPR) repeat protein